MHYHLQVCTSLTKNLRYYGTTDCTKTTGSVVICASCQTLNLLSIEAADVIEHYAKSWEAFFTASEHMGHCKRKTKQNIFVQRLLSASEETVLDLDVRFKASVGGGKPKNTPIDHYHWLADFFMEHGDDIKLLTPRPPSSKPRFGSHKMQLRIAQLEHITSIIDLLDEVRRHACSYFCHCEGTTEQHVNTRGDLKLEVAHNVMSTRSRLLSSESQVKDGLAKLSDLTSNVPGIAEGYLNMVTLITYWYQPMEDCRNSRDRHGSEQSQSERGIGHSHDAEELHQLLQALDVPTTTPGGQDKPFVEQLQTLRAQHEALLNNAATLVKQMAEMQASQGRVYGDTSIGPGATAILGDVVYNYIFQAGLNEQRIDRSDPELPALMGHLGVNAPLHDPSVNTTRPSVVRAAHDPMSSMRDLSSPVRTYQQPDSRSPTGNQRYAGVSRASAMPMIGASSSIAHSSSNSSREASRRQSYSSPSLSDPNPAPDSALPTSYHEMPVHQTQDTTLTYVPNQRSSRQASSAHRPSRLAAIFDAKDSGTPSEIQQRNNSTTGPRRKPVNTAPPPYSEIPTHEHSTILDTKPARDDSGSLAASEPPVQFAAYFAESLLWPASTDSAQSDVGTRAASANTSRESRSNRPAGLRTARHPSQSGSQPDRNPFRRFR